MLALAMVQQPPVTASACCWSAALNCVLGRSPPTTADVTPNNGWRHPQPKREISRRTPKDTFQRSRDYCTLEFVATMRVKAKRGGNYSTVAPTLCPVNGIAQWFPEWGKLPPGCNMRFIGG